MGGEGGETGPAARGVMLATAWLGGLALQLQQPALWPAGVAGWACAGAAAAMLVVWPWRRRWPGALALAAALALVAFASTTLRAQWRLDDRLDPSLEGQDVIAAGIVAELPRSGPAGVRFVFETEVATLQGRPVRLPERLFVGWYRMADDEGPLSGPPEAFRAGQRWRLALRLRALHGTLNPQGFDLELWGFERELGGSGYVRARPETPPVLLDEAAAHPVERLRQRVKDAMQQRVHQADAAGVLAALAIGDQAAIDRDGWDVFRVTGVAHLMSISGLHVTMFAWLAGAVVGWLWRRHPRLPLVLPAPQAARLGGLLAAAGYALVAGWGVPAQRTVWMIGVVVLLRAFGANWPLHAVLLAAAVAVTVADPWAMLQPGFWLSFVAVALLVASEPAHAWKAPAAAGWPARLGAALRGGLRSQLVATVGLAPLSMLFFQQVSIVGFVANLVAIPLVTLLVTPLALLGVALPPLWIPAAALVGGLMAYLKALAALPLATWTAAAAPPWAMACGLLAALLAVAPLPWRQRLLALPLMLPLLMPAVPRPAEGGFELVAADVGQGTAVIVRTRAHGLLFDTGPAYSLESDAGGRVLLPLLRARGEHRLDLLVLSHRDTDHVGGAASVLAGLPVELVASSLAEDHPLRAKPVPHRRCDAGQSWAWDGVRFEILHPPAEDHARPLKPNALSCVLRVTAADGRAALLTGDIEAPQEAALVQRLGAGLRAEVLVVPHHGSRTSSTAAFLAAVQPRVAVVQAAWRSRFGHPAPEVVARYEAAGIAVVRSDRCGAWTRPADPVDPPRCERDAARRYWHHRPFPPP